MGSLNRRRENSFHETVLVRRPINFPYRLLPARSLIDTDRNREMSHEEASGLHGTEPPYATSIAKGLHLDDRTKSWKPDQRCILFLFEHSPDREWCRLLRIKSVDAERSLLHSKNHENSLLCRCGSSPASADHIAYRGFLTPIHKPGGPASSHSAAPVSSAQVVRRSVRRPPPTAR